MDKDNKKLGLGHRLISALKNDYYLFIICSLIVAYGSIGAFSYFTHWSKQGTVKTPTEMPRKNIRQRLKNMETGIIRGKDNKGVLYVSTLPSTNVDRQLIFFMSNGANYCVKNNVAFLNANVGDTIRYLNPRKEITVKCMSDLDADFDRRIVSVNGISADDYYERHIIQLRQKEIQKVQDDFERSLSR